MISRRLIALITILITIYSNTIFCVDLTTFYRTPLFQGEAKRNVSDWTTHIDLQYAEGSTKKAWNTEEVKTCLFNDHGPFDMRKLAANMECLDYKPLTKAYYDGDIPNLYDGRLVFTGKFNLDEWHITLQQNILWGLYLQAHIPIRRLKLTCIDYTTCVTTEAEQQQIADFVDQDLDAILEENCIKPLKCDFKRSEISDPLLSIGWHGHCTISNGILTALRGYIQGGIILPVGKRRDIDRVFSLPTGYNKHFGFNARFNIHGTFWEKAVLGANAGVSVFLDQTYEQRLTTSTDQNGWIMLEKGKASVDQGTIWDATIYAKAERIFGGFSVLAAYSYTEQERTVLTLDDECVLRTALANEVIKNKDEVINSNKQLRSWFHHALHFYAQYDFGAHIKKVVAPTIRISYHYPLHGKRAWPTDMWSGTLSLALDWCW